MTNITSGAPAGETGVTNISVDPNACCLCLAAAEEAADALARLCPFDSETAMGIRRTNTKSSL